MSANTNQHIRHQEPASHKKTNLIKWRKEAPKRKVGDIYKKELE